MNQNIGSYTAIKYIWKNGGLMLFEEYKSFFTNDHITNPVDYKNKAILWNGPLGFRILPLNTLSEVWKVDVPYYERKEKNININIVYTIFKKLELVIPSDYQIIGFFYYNNKTNSIMEEIINHSTKIIHNDKNKKD